MNKSGKSTVIIEQQICKWQVSICIVGIVPVIQIIRNGQLLKTTPSELRKNPAFKVVKDEVEKLKNQIRRFRNLLESMMSLAESIPNEDLRDLSKIPAVRVLLENLIGINERQEIGLIDAANMQLIDGKSNYYIGKSVRIAHVYDLVNQEVLPYWQQLIVDREMVQPFKQVFREVYLITPAEKEEGRASERFAGYAIRSKVAYRLFETRGWVTDFNGAFKDGLGGRYSAMWQFSNIHHYFSGSETIISGKIYFGLMVDGNRIHIPLCDISPIVFSEVMRDADLVSSVASTGEDPEEVPVSPSVELLQYRATVVRYLTDRLGITKLRFENNFVHVSGKLANYRIHLSHGGVYLDNGPHICITPAGTISGKGYKLYLPFADEDKIITEIISKILLLNNDEKITDDSICMQIRRCLNAEYEAS
jgi:HAMP domain-containing protein